MTTLIVQIKEATNQCLIKGIYLNDRAFIGDETEAR